MSAGSHLSGEFIAWNTSYVAVQIHYNPSNVPSSAPDANGIASLASITYSLWADQFFSLTIQNAPPFTTTAGQTEDDLRVISWFNAYYNNEAAEAHSYPNNLITGTVYGPNNYTGVDVWFNYYIEMSAWYFNQTPPSSRNYSQIDVVEILAHEL